MHYSWTLVIILESKLCPPPPLSRKVPVTGGLCCSFTLPPSSPLRGWAGTWESRKNSLFTLPGLSSLVSLVVQTVLPPCEQPHGVAEKFLPFPVASYLCLARDSASVPGIQMLAFSWWCVSGFFRGWGVIHLPFLRRSDQPQGQTLPHQALTWTTP